MKKDIHTGKITKTALAAFALLLCTCPRLQASASETVPDTASAGNIVYERAMDSVAIYTEDITLLKKGLSGVCAKTYDPASYGHIHQWEYADITENAHTECCTQCGAAVKLVNAHTEDFSEKCVIAYDGKDYPGYRYVCACGFDWLRERHHTPVYTPVNATSHSASCALRGTAYCEGLGEIEGEHISILCATDESHHKAVCEYCKYESPEEACIFDIESCLDENGAAQISRYCKCGNHLPVSAKPPEENTETGEEPAAPPEEVPDTSAEPSTPTDEESKTGEESTVPPEKETDPGKEPAVPPEKETDPGKEPAVPPLKEAEEDEKAQELSPALQGEEAENQGGKE